MKCDRACEVHEGLVRPVNVKSPTHSQFEWDFNYCQTAVDEDRKHGFTVTEIKEDEL